MKADNRLHCFENGVDTVIAYSPEDAIRVWEETTGEKYFDYCESDDLFEQVPDDKFYTLYEDECIDHPPIPEGAELIERGEYSFTYKATCRAWADARGRCFLGSTEY